jgi:hypothetical protein
MGEQQEQGVEVAAGVETTREARSSYPLPQLLAYLETTRGDEQEYAVLARLLRLCGETVEHANALWRAGRFEGEGEETLETAFEAVQYSFRRLIPFILRSVVGGWRELLLYLPDPETCPWYNPLTDQVALPPFQGEPHAPKR